ncbi:bile acid:sodium symporter family protein [Olsenella profusa]|uniref:Bile acid:sodium symporter family protein n=1 Tax=Olsenella profusa TaxID=138595 RepID=A0ABS2F298_9ACTN|nr:bile acid:sodium symporter family protein [Olsenella profusa]MBM6775005.1 bile acid:sodium symporter family protein [Olsenella profusa]
MDAWRRLGSFLGSHMAFVSPTCVVLGVLFPDQLSVLKPAVTALFAFMTFQSSLSNTFANLARTVRHPAPMLATLAIASVAMPCVACALGTLLFGSDPNLVCGLVLEYSVPVAVVAAMWINMHGGDPSLGLATILVSTVAAPFSIPLTLHLLLGQTVEVDAARMMGEMVVSIALPALLGTAANDLSHGRAARELSPVIAPAAKIALVLVILTNSTGVAPYVRSLTPTLVAVAAFVCVFAASGYAVGLLVARAWHRPAGQQVTMTYLCGMRNISAGAVIAGEYFPGEVMFPVVIGTLFQQVLAATYGSVLQRLGREDASLEGASSEGVSSDDAPSDAGTRN